MQVGPAKLAGWIEKLGLVPVEESDEPVARWRPRRFPNATGEDVEMYIHMEGRWEDKTPQSWPPRMPGSSE